MSQSTVTECFMESFSIFFHLMLKFIVRTFRLGSIWKLHFVLEDRLLALPDRLYDLEDSFKEEYFPSSFVLFFLEPIRALIHFLPSVSIASSNLLEEMIVLATPEMKVSERFLSVSYIQKRKDVASLFAFLRKGEMLIGTWRDIWMCKKFLYLRCWIREFHINRIMKR